MELQSAGEHISPLTMWLSDRFAETVFGQTPRQLFYSLDPAAASRGEAAGVGYADVVNIATMIIVGAQGGGPGAPAVGRGAVSVEAATARRVVANEINFGRAGRVVPNEIGFGRTPYTRPGTAPMERIAPIQRVDPATIRFSQNTAGGRGRADVLRQSMRERGWSGDPVDAVRTPDGLVTLDNTRVAVARELGIRQIPVRVHAPTDPLPPDMLTRPWNRAGDTATT